MCPWAPPRASRPSTRRSSTPARTSTARAPPTSRSARGQELVFRETDKKPADYDGHHIQVYVANFSRPHKALVERGALSEESNQYQYRFLDIVDPDSGRKLFQIEHEVRSITHPMYLRPLLNRNPRQNNRSYVPGRDGFVPEVEAEELPGRVRFG